MRTPIGKDGKCELPAALRPLADDIAKNLRQQIAALPQLVPMCYLFNTATGRDMAIEMAMADLDEKEKTAQIIHLFAEDLQANLCIVASEGWGLPERDIVRSREILARYGSISNYPARIDTVYIHIETLDGVYWVQREILPAYGKLPRRVKGDFIFVKMEHAEGRLMNFLTSSRIRAAKSGANFPESEYYRGHDNAAG